MPDHEVHEIQLNGKQLVFMFMAATVVSVVIFLCGVMVGRGVRQPEVAVLAAGTDIAVDPTTPDDTATSRSASPADPPPASPQENLTYAEHLEARVAPDEPLKRSDPKPTVAPAVAEKEKAAPLKPAPPRVAAAQETNAPVQPPPVPQRATPQPAAPQKAALKSEPVAERASFAEPPGKGFVLQVQAFSTRADADALAGRLSGKGYQAFVTLNPANVREKYRVRVGKYATRSEADAVSNRLRQEERFVPWRIP